MFRNKLLPKEEGFLTYIYLANLFIPLYFLLQEEGGKLLADLSLLRELIVEYYELFSEKEMEIEITIPETKIM